MTQTVEYELATLVRDEDGEVLDANVLLPKDGDPFPRMRVEEGGNVREEVMRKHHALVSGIPCKDVVVNARPFAKA